ncbi:MAG: hypothetical protein ICV78_12385 [Tolypothrix sp. Co-bin9]|nr:hypothetical protein [Tolypothrix sp. Co-bin9]
MVTFFTPKTLRAMTCHAPYAYALSLELKTEEYRYRPTQYRGWVFFHSGLSTASDDAFEYLDITPQEAQRGCIIGAGYLNDCEKIDNYFAYKFSSAILFDKPLKIRGKQPILWQPANDYESRIFDSAWQILKRMHPIVD